MLCYTGDIHGKLTKIDDAMQKGLLTNGDVLVILGDAGFNYYGGTKDKKLKCQLGKYDLTVFCIHGNHEMRPEGITSYKTKAWNGGTVIRVSSMALRHFCHIYYLRCIFFPQNVETA